MATLDDILTCQKNGVVAINNLSQSLTSFYNSYTYLSGKTTSPTVAVPTILTQGAGRLVSYNTIVAGSAGTIVDTVAYNIKSASFAAGVATITYAGLKAYALGDTITIAGCGGYDGTFVVTSQTPPATITYAIAGPLSTITNQGVIYVKSASQVLTGLSTTVDTHLVGCNFTNGLLALPGSGQSVNVTYSLS